MALNFQSPDSEEYLNGVQKELERIDKERRKRNAKISIVLILIGIVWVIGSFIYMKVVRQNAFITGSQAKVIDQRAQEIEIAVSENTVTDVIDEVAYNADEAGTTVALLQNQLLNPKFLNIEPNSDLAVEEAELLHQLKTYIDTTNTGRGSTIGGTWIFGDDITWEFGSTYDFVGVKSPVVWICRNSKGELFAYATATYDATKNMFYGTVVHATAAYDKYLDDLQQTTDYYDDSQNPGDGTWDDTTGRDDDEEDIWGDRDSDETSETISEEGVDE